jgi:Na+-transporting NADH:ubiquinone oxidoreductase subunit C
LSFKQFYSLINPTINNSINPDSIFNFILLEGHNEQVKSNSNKTIELFIENIDRDMPTQLPIFEIKNSNDVILPFSGKGMWDKIWGAVLLNRDSLLVKNIFFNHRGETPGLGAEIKYSQFENQFENKKISLTSNSFTLKENGKNNIDGLTGATITSESVVNILNEYMLNYKTYLEEK